MKNGIWILMVLGVGLAAVARGDDLLKEPARWGETISEKAVFYKAADVSDSAVTLTRKWYDAAAKAWGNYGPTEFWLVGKSAEAAEELNRKYCEVRKEKDPQLRLKDCLSRDYSFEDYVRDGGAGLNTRRGEHSDWSGFIITMDINYQ